MQQTMPGFTLKSDQKETSAVMRHWRLLAYAGIGAALVIFELLEHSADKIFENIPFAETALYIGFLLLVSILTESIIISEANRKQTLRLLEIKHQLSLYLSTAITIQELTEMVLNFLRQIRQAEGIILLDFDPEGGVVEQGNWQSANTSTVLSAADKEKIFQACLPGQNCGSLQELDLQDHTDKPVKGQVLPLHFGEEPVGAVVIVVSRGQTIPAHQKQILENTSPEIAAALATARNRQNLRNAAIANSASAERLEIARDLHDTLGQNLGFLHFRLDQILTTLPMQENPDFYSGLSKLRDLTNESYETVRETLVILNRDSRHSLEHFLHVQADQIADRAGFKLAIQEHGEPRPLSPRHVRQLSFVFKEILRNVEKHAFASQVSVNLDWSSAGLIVMVQDDGLGFDIQDVPQTNHYGLKIMKDRIEGLGGTFALVSSRDQGTVVKFQIPVDDVKSPSAV